MTTLSQIICVGSKLLRNKATQNLLKPSKRKIYRHPPPTTPCHKSEFTSWKLLYQYLVTFRQSLTGLLSQQDFGSKLSTPFIGYLILDIERPADYMRKAKDCAEWIRVCNEYQRNQVSRPTQWTHKLLINFHNSTSSSLLKCLLSCQVSLLMSSEFMYLIILFCVSFHPKKRMPSIKLKIFHFEKNCFASRRRCIPIINNISVYGFSRNALFLTQLCISFLRQTAE